MYYDHVIHCEPHGSEGPVLSRYWAATGEAKLAYNGVTYRLADEMGLDGCVITYYRAHVIAHVVECVARCLLT